MTDSPIKIAVLDDYQNIALKMADWSSISGNPEIKVFNDHISELEPLVERLFPFNVVCIMRERQKSKSTELRTKSTELLRNHRL